MTATVVDRLASRVRERRAARGLSQSALAASCGLSRQSVHAIEAGRAVPAVDVALRMARALDCAVEVLFGEESIDASLLTEPVGDIESGRVALAHIGGRWLSYPLRRESFCRSADALASRRVRGKLEVEPLRSPAGARENVVMMGCAPALGVLAERLNAAAGPGRFLWVPGSSVGALEALARRQSHISGVHLVDAKTGEANVPDTRRSAPQRAFVLITLARWEAGWVVAPGNPKRIRGAGDLARKNLHLVARESGSGARRLLERELRRAELPLELARQAHLHETGHLEVAQAVHLGAADLGMATRDAAMAFGLSFLPLAEERFDLVVPSEAQSDPRLARLFDVLSAVSFRRELASLGYDVAACGARAAEILVA